MDESQRIEGHLARTHAEVDSREGLEALIRHNLSNFAYRYISTKNTEAPEVITLSDGVFAVSSVEDDLLLGLKLGGEQTKKQLIAMAREKGKGATVGQRLLVDVSHVDPKRSFTARICAQISWDSPNHRYEDQFAERVLKVDYEDALDMRNRLALALEEVCAFF